MSNSRVRRSGGGKPAGMRDDEAIRGAKAWYRERYNHPDNVHLVAYTELLKNVSRFHKSTHTLKDTWKLYAKFLHGQLRFIIVTVPSVHLVQK
ncbi:hypothetical protein BU17DRAFT_93875 [Hysterangium stoloniferum]|nr:hypothetical protein BU17DRAFT_103478 [Hysterangium stoloniferum]KAF8515162.1 hypothetical protein BU17DRAFT_93875 [Hysterangium stoloniferum]